jgi:hypothetical protein
MNRTNFVILRRPKGRRGSLPLGRTKFSPEGTHFISKRYLENQFEIFFHDEWAANVS